MTYHSILLRPERDRRATVELYKIWKERLAGIK
jgi:hypothetical protein